MSKYEPLSDRLRSHAGDEWRTSFSDLEQVLGFALPKTARAGRKWWVNDPDKGHSRAWAGAGWEVGDIDPTAEQVIFRRSAASAAVIQQMAHLEPLAESTVVEPPQTPAMASPPTAMEPSETVRAPASTDLETLAAEDEAEEEAVRAKRTRQLGMGALVAGAAAVVAGVGALVVKLVARRR